MGVIPMKEDVGQEIYTRDHGIVKVDKNSWQDGRFHIVLGPNGAYQHMNGLPVENEEQLVEAFGGYGGSNTDALEKALNWFRNRHEQLANPPRPISFRSDNTPVFADGSIPEESDLYNFFSPGPVLSAAIVGLHEFRKRKESGAAPQELRKAAPPSAETVTEPSPQAAPAPDPLKYSAIARKQAKDKARKAAARATTKAAKAATG